MDKKCADKDKLLKVYETEIALLRQRLHQQISQTSQISAQEVQAKLETQAHEHSLQMGRVERQLDEVRGRAEVIARENERMRQEIEERGQREREREEGWEEERRRHREEVENLKLGH